MGGKGQMYIVFQPELKHMQLVINLTYENPGMSSSFLYH